MTTIEKLNVAENDEELQKTLEKAETVEEIISAYAAKGVSLTAEELEAVCTDELSEDALDDVAGGFVGGKGGCVILLGELLRRLKEKGRK